MSSHKIYIAAALIIAFMLGVGYEYYQCQIRVSRIQMTSADEKKRDTGSPLLYLDKDSILAYDTIYKRYIAREKIKNHLIEYVTDTIVRALNQQAQEGVNTFTTKMEHQPPESFAHRDTISLYKRLADSFATECKYYQTQYRQLVLSYAKSKKTDTIRVDSNQSLLFKNRWEYTKFLGIPIGRQGYTDIYYGAKTPFPIRQDQLQFGMRLQAVTSFNFATNSYQLGGILRFDLHGSQASFIYYYDLKERRMMPVISLNKDILRIR